MQIDSGNLALKGLDDLFSTEENRQEEQREQVQQIPIDDLHPFTNHPFKVLDDAAVLFQSGCGAPSDAGASSGNDNDLVGFFCHDFPPENVDLVRGYRIAGRLSILIAGLWKSTGINLRKILRRLASLFYTANAN